MTCLTFPTTFGVPTAMKTLLLTAYVQHAAELCEQQGLTWSIPFLHQFFQHFKVSVLALLEYWSYYPPGKHQELLYLPL
uniref:Uncharacterized protein n=1 Tax=Anguilla anguilla TaxID=7936 RepID=A0A0E9WYA5_ANGAN